jgi:hypothetical protein
MTDKEAEDLEASCMYTWVLSFQDSRQSSFPASQLSSLFNPYHEIKLEMQSTNGAVV